MNVSPSKENILKKIRKALSHSTPLPFPNSEGTNSVFEPLQQEAEVEFAEQFTKLQGKFIYCINRQELAFQLGSLVKKQDWQKVYCVEDKLIEPVALQLSDRLIKTGLENCDVSITGCEYLVARTGSIVMSTAQSSGRSTSVYAPIHICIAFTNQLVYDLKDALQAAKDKYGNNLPSLITFATGPSRTADIEKTLVVGVHGPKEVYLFLVES
ncbi:MAG: lactate utilization protein [Chitinophagaceae bacterium]|nr:lactate utilization protein [Chitinophagaceae bacterium]HQV84435.1 lactate utilization protein [Chitinophagaceae bacterium]HQX72187.1 lactate utilization protein [Chitinophagaceae bacterium]